MTPAKIFSIIGLVLLVGVSVWLQNAFEQNDKKSRDNKERHDPDYYIENFVLTSMADDGQPQHRISAPYMQHFPDDDTTELTSPTILMFRKDSPPWLIKSDRGSFSKNAELVFLSGNVTISRKSGPQNQSVQLFTDTLKIHPDTEFAETDSRVVMKSNTQRTEGTGMRAYIRKGVLQLLDNVKVYYE